MRFHRLDLIKYGKFSGRSVEFPAAPRDFHLIVGPNEAGKSTLRSAILDLLFGIPTRSPLAFLHPLNELRLGAVVGNRSASLEFHRAKALRQTLRSPQDAVLADTALAPFLGTADRHFFDQMFGLDHGRLVAGGNSILSAENDVGQVLFQSAAGVASLGKIRDALLAEADKLWAPRKAADRAYYIGAEQLEKASAALKDATVRTKVWAEASTRLEAVKEELASTSGLLRQLEIRRSRLERVRRTAPFLRAVREIEGQLAELGSAAALPADAARVLAEAERELATAGQLLNLRSNEADKATRALAEITVDEAILGIAARVTELDERRLQYRAYEHDIGLREKEAESLLREIRDACAQLGWECGSEEILAAHLPTVLVRRELARLARSHGGLVQALRAAEQAERAKASEIRLLSRELAQLHAAEASPALRAALAGARSVGDPHASGQQLQNALAKARAALSGAALELGRWGRPAAELAAMQTPGQQTLSRLAQERHALAADQKAQAKRLEEQNALVASLALEIAQFKELHQPVTQAAVMQARRDRSASWDAIKAGKVGVAQGAQQFEASVVRADELADHRLDNVEAATELQSRLHRLEREKLNQSALGSQLSRLDDRIRQFDAQWDAMASGFGLPGIALDDIGDWLAKRDKVLSAADACQAAQDSADAFSRLVCASAAALADALREAGLEPAVPDSLPALYAQAESHIQAVDGAKVRHETLSAQLKAATALAETMRQATEGARAEVDCWREDWTRALSKAGLAEDSEIGAAEGALELIAQVEDRLSKVRQIRVERIDAMKADLAQFDEEANRLARAVDPALCGRPPARIAQELAARLQHAREAHAETARLKAVLRDAQRQVARAQESIETATASLKPLMERAGVGSHALLSEAIGRSDLRRQLDGELAKAKANLLDGGDGLSREQIEGEVDAADLAQLAAELAQLDGERSEAVQRQAALSAEQEKALGALSAIGGSGAAAEAEAQRQEALAQMADAAERYVKVFTAARMLRWSIDRYREEKQGPLLGRAGAIFAKLTQGAFQRLVVDFEAQPMTLEGQRADGKLVGVAGMSDGTRDQLYLALRLAALELHLEQATPLPFIADDLFINYDDGRSRAGFEALAALSEKAQVIYLTHHDHLVPAVQEVFGAQVNVVHL